MVGRLVVSVGFTCLCEYGYWDFLCRWGYVYKSWINGAVANKWILQGTACRPWSVYASVPSNFKSPAYPTCGDDKRNTSVGWICRYSLYSSKVTRTVLGNSRTVPWNGLFPGDFCTYGSTSSAGGGREDTVCGPCELKWKYKYHQRYWRTILVSVVVDIPTSLQCNFRTWQVEARPRSRYLPHLPLGWQRWRRCLERNPQEHRRCTTTLARFSSPSGY